MRIIEKIEIKYFRSFDGGVGQPKAEIVNIKDINIFSGANDSGKSNILRALNLFFNDEISPGVPFDLERDLSKIQKSRSDNKINSKRAVKGKKAVRQRDLWVKIRIYFNKEEGGVLPEKFYVEKMWDKNGLSGSRKHNIKKNPDQKKAHAQEGQLSLFLNNISFEYVPAVKDRQFFNILFKKLQTYLFAKQDKKNDNKFTAHSSKFNDLLKAETQSLFEEFGKSVGLKASFKIPETLVDFFRTLGVETENGISLFDRGDGIQARFIPDILNEISKDSRKKVIWGFEEPENSYEPLRCFELAQDFLKYSDKKQIFITSHAFPFVGLKGVGVSSYRVKNENNVSRIGLINWEQRTIKGLGIENDADKLEKEIGVLELYSEMSKHLGEEIEKPIIYVEGKWDKIYLEKAWQAIFPNEKNKFEIIDKGGKRIVNAIEDAAKSSSNRKVIAICDRDEAGEEYFSLKENDIKDLFEIVPNDQLVKKHKSKMVYIILLNNPASRANWVDPNHKKILEIEHLFEDEFIKSLGIKIPPCITKTAKEWETSGEFKRKLGNKINSLKKEDLRLGDFKNFQVLFNKINKLLEI